MKALILVDLQNDFFAGGALAVPDAHRVLGPANRLQPLYEHVILTQDWHPAEHGSFAESHAGREPGENIELHGLQQILWPAHCVAGTTGADFVPGLQIDPRAVIFQKGTDPTVDSYSGFFDNGRRKATGLGDFLKEKGVQEVHIAGLATDYCVKFTLLDALSLGFRAALISDASRGVNLQSGDVEKAHAEMREAGAELVESAKIVVDHEAGC